MTETRETNSARICAPPAAHRRGKMDSAEIAQTTQNTFGRSWGQREKPVPDYMRTFLQAEGWKVVLTAQEDADDQLKKNSKTAAL